MQDCEKRLHGDALLFEPAELGLDLLLDALDDTFSCGLDRIAGRLALVEQLVADRLGLSAVRGSEGLSVRERKAGPPPRKSGRTHATSPSRTLPCSSWLLDSRSRCATSLWVPD